VLGAAAVQCLATSDKTNIMVGISSGNKVVEAPFDEVVDKSNRQPQEILKDHPKWQELSELHNALACPPDPALQESLHSRGNRFTG